MEYRAISFMQKFGLFHEQWQPRVIAEMNDYQFKVVKLQGDFIWHDHKDTDETFIVIEGEFADRFPRRCGTCPCRRDVRGSQGGGAQTVRRERGQVASDRATWHA